ncbi:hypothetical protein JOQ06_019568 [Pogonophryne albipinna]|uniref:Transposase Tc1-like domain-containing protein n=1 Tax=Pogonophryne albipinna TaxID=1090488 RepID=A0AAD6ACG7_9TELE|nr:hypothetical protein JOQ06_019568 [Pogonophryne albipinna]
MITRTVSKDPRTTRGDLVNDLQRAGTKVTKATISNTLRRQGLKSCSARQDWENVIWLDVQDSRRDTINPEDMEELKRQLDRISKDIKEKRSTPTCNPPPRDPEENYDRTLETCSSPTATSTPGACQEIPYCMEEDPENWAPPQTSAFTGVIEGTIHPTIPEK